MSSPIFSNFDVPNSRIWCEESHRYGVGSFSLSLGQVFANQQSTPRTSAQCQRLHFLRIPHTDSTLKENFSGQREVLPLTNCKEASLFVPLTLLKIQDITYGLRPTAQPIFISVVCCSPESRSPGQLGCSPPSTPLLPVVPISAQELF